MSQLARLQSPATTLALLRFPQGLVLDQPPNSPRCRPTAFSTAWNRCKIPSKRLPGKHHPSVHLEQHLATRSGLDQETKIGHRRLHPPLMRPPSCQHQKHRQCHSRPRRGLCRLTIHGHDSPRHSLARRRTFPHPTIVVQPCVSPATLDPSRPRPLRETVSPSSFTRSQAPKPGS